jgi:hypothetical protein
MSNVAFELAESLSANIALRGSARYRSLSSIGVVHAGVRFGVAEPEPGPEPGVDMDRFSSSYSLPIEEKDWMPRSIPSRSYAYGPRRESTDNEHLTALHLLQHPSIFASKIAVEVHHTWPLNEIFSAHVMERYNACLQRLLEIYSLKWGFEGLWKPLNSSRIFESRGNTSAAMSSAAVDNDKDKDDMVMVTVMALKSRCAVQLSSVLFFLNSLQTSYMSIIHGVLFRSLLDVYSTHSPATSSSSASVSSVSSSAFSVVEIDHIHSTFIETVFGVLKKDDRELRRILDHAAAAMRALDDLLAFSIPFIKVYTDDLEEESGGSPVAQSRGKGRSSCAQRSYLSIEVPRRHQRALNELNANTEFRLLLERTESALTATRDACQSLVVSLKSETFDANRYANGSKHTTYISPLQAPLYGIRSPSTSGYDYELGKSEAASLWTAQFLSLIGSGSGDSTAAVD